MTSLGERFMYAASAALAAWRDGPSPPDVDALQLAYAQKWSLYDGTLFSEAVNPYQNDPAIYQGTKLLWKHVEAVVDFYAGVVYMGSLADDPEQGAIPWKLLVPGDATAINADGTPVRSPAQELWSAVTELQDAWNWQQKMTQRSRYTAALGDGLTELADNLDRRFVFPLNIWPGYVKTVEMDESDNVQSYTLEYRVEERDDRGNRLETYTYRKEVDGETFRYFKDDRPFDYSDTNDGAVVVNPYGFCPAIWDRHLPGAQGMIRGRAATDGTRQALMQHSSIFSHAFDYQRKAFWQPVVLSVARSGGSRTVDLSAPNGTAAELAQSQPYVTVPEGANLLQATVDIGQTRELLNDLREGILAENPEASFYQQLRDMQQVTGPGAAFLQGDVDNRVQSVRAGADTQTIKLFQMAISMCGMRANGDEWKRRNPGRALTRRQAVFLPFDIESYDRGELEMKILPRPLVPETPASRVQFLAQVETLQSTWALREAGLSDDEIADIQSERQAQVIADFGGGIEDEGEAVA